MSEQVEFWDAGTLSNQTSERLYTRLYLPPTADGEINGHPYYRVNSLYIDDITGIAVGDVAAFERWIR